VSGLYSEAVLFEGFTSVPLHELEEQRGFRAVALVARGTRVLPDADGFHVRNLAIGGKRWPAAFAYSAA
jgi:hypothetical protein